MAEKDEASVQRFVEAVANKQGWEVNPETSFRNRIVKGLLTNHQRHGYFLCPCRDGEGERQADRDIICPCEYAWKDIEEHGHCFCALFINKKVKQDILEGKTPDAIPERRPEEKFGL